MPAGHLSAPRGTVISTHSCWFMPGGTVIDGAFVPHPFPSMAHCRETPGSPGQGGADPSEHLLYGTNPSGISHGGGPNGRPAPHIEPFPGSLGVPLPAGPSGCDGR